MRQGTERSGKRIERQKKKEIDGGGEEEERKRETVAEMCRKTKL